MANERLPTEATTRVNARSAWMEGRAKSSGQGIFPGVSMHCRGSCRNDLNARPRRSATATATTMYGIFRCSRRMNEIASMRSAEKSIPETGSLRNTDASRTGGRTSENASRKSCPKSIVKESGSCLLFLALESATLVLMVPEKKPRVRQASLLDAPEEKPDSVDSLVARAFDSDPKVRLKVAQDLGRIDDPRAVFALIELSSDKEEAVKDAAQRSLGNFKEDAETIVSLEKMLQERKEQKGQPAPLPSQSQRPQSMAPTIERLFSHYEPKKRESVKRKLFPSLQKLFGFSKQELDPLQDIEKMVHAPTPASQVMEVAGKEDDRIPAENAPNFPFGQKKDIPQPKDLVEMDEEDRLFAEAKSGPLEPRLQSDAEFVSPHQEEEAREISEEEPSAGNKFYALAHRLATTPGMGKTELKAEQNRLISNFKKEVEIAFKVAFARAKEEGFASLENLKPGMKNLSFAEMPIASVMEIPYGAKKKPYLRISIWDGKKETPVLVPKERGSGILVSDRLELKKVDVDFLVEKNEIVLVVSKKSKVIVVK